MSYPEWTNSTARGPRIMSSEIVFSVIAVVLLCCAFLFVNGTMLFTLRSKALFRGTSRYLLLFNLLVADTMQLAHSQLMFMLASVVASMTYPVCGVLVMFASLTNKISPLTLAAMSVERYVAVCFPLRHAAVVTVRNTGVAILGVWTFSSFSVLIQVLLMLQFPFEDLETLQMGRTCTSHLIVFLPVSEDYATGSTCFMFVTAGLLVIFSYICVMAAATSATTDKASAQKARNTLLLHMGQLGLSLCSTITNPLLLSLLKIMNRITFMRVQSVFYVGIIILPRCLSVLIYGLRDQNIRPVFLYHLGCQRRSPSQLADLEKCKISLVVT